jgi:hypothetical protein
VSTLVSSLAPSLASYLALVLVMIICKLKFTKIKQKMVKNEKNEMKNGKGMVGYEPKSLAKR